MENRILVSVGGLLVVFVVFAVFLHREHHGRYTDSQSIDEVVKNSRRPVERLLLDALRARGFQIVAERIGRSSAEGKVKIVTQEGAIYYGDDLRVSPKEDAFLLTGSVRVARDGVLLSSKDDNAWIRICTDGNVYCSSGRWATVAQQGEKNGVSQNELTSPH